MGPVEDMSPSPTPKLLPSRISAIAYLTFETSMVFPIPYFQNEMAGFLELDPLQRYAATFGP